MSKASYKMRCLLSDNSIEVFSMALPVTSDKVVSKDFIKIGVGRIYSYNNIPYNSSKLFFFYVAKKSNKYKQKMQLQMAMRKFREL